MPRAISYDALGPPEVLHLVDVPALEAGPGQVRVAVRTAGVNPIDWKVRSGRMSFGPPKLPATPGAEFAGVIDQVGEGVEGFAVGDEVLGRAGATYAEQVLANPASVAIKPADVSFEQAAALPVAVSAAYRALVPLGLELVETLLVDGAAGGVGGILVQAAVAAACTSSARRRSVVTSGCASRRRRRSPTAPTSPCGSRPWSERRRRRGRPGREGVARRTLLHIVGDPAKLVTIVDGANAERLGVRFSGGPLRRDRGSHGRALRLIGEGKLTVPVGSG